MFTINHKSKVCCFKFVVKVSISHTHHSLHLESYNIVIILQVSSSASILPSQLLSISSLHKFSAPGIQAPRTK